MRPARVGKVAAWVRFARANLGVGPTSHGIVLRAEWAGCHWTACSQCAGRGVRARHTEGLDRIGALFDASLDFEGVTDYVAWK